MNVSEMERSCCSRKFSSRFSPESSWLLFSLWQVFWLAFMMITFPSRHWRKSGIAVQHVHRKNATKRLQLRG